MIYLDHAATSPMTRPVLEAMWPFMSDVFANASSQHEAGKLAARGLEAARADVASILHCRPAEILFTSGGTEGDNTAIKGMALATPKGRHIVTSAIEHEAVLETCEYLERHHGFHTTRVPVNGDGLVDLDALDNALDAETTLCSVQYANNEVGTVQPISDISAICRSKGVAFHTDAVQAAGVLSLDVGELGVDLLSISGHKFGGPKATGVLFVRQGLRIEPLMHGGGQERGRRSGTSNVAGAVGLASALQIADMSRDETAGRLTSLRDRLITGVSNVSPESVLTGHPHNRLPQHASFCFRDVSGESVLLELEARGIACSSGSACAAGSDEPSYVLRALGIPDQLAQTAVRFTLGAENTEDEIDEAIARVGEALQSVRALRA